MNVFDWLFKRSKATRQQILGSTYELPALAQTMDAARISGILRSAESGNMDEFFALGRDIIAGHGHSQTEFGKRKLAVLANTQTITAVNDKNPLETAVASALSLHFERLPTWFTGMVHLLDSTLYPVSVLEKVYAPSTRPGWRFELKDLIPVPYRLFDFSTGTLRIRDVGDSGEPLGSTHELDPLRYIIHRGHLLTSIPDTWGGPMRAILFWWLFATMDRDWWARFLERFGAPFIEGKYNKSDDQSRRQLERAFSAATRLFGIAIPDDASVTIHQANSTQGGDAFDKFHAAANAEISKIILGQTSSAQLGNTGLADGGAADQAEVRDDIRQFDAMMLGATVRTQLIAPLCELNGWPVPAPRPSWGGDDIAELEVTGDLIESLANAGLRLTDEGVTVLSKRMALPLERSPLPAAPPPPGGLPGQPQPAPGAPAPAAAPDPLAAPSPGPLSALATPDPGHQQAANSTAARDAVDRLAEVAAPTLFDELARTLAPLAAAVDASTSLSDLEARLRGLVPTLDHRGAASVAAGVLTACSANAALNSRTA